MTQQKWLVLPDFQWPFHDQKTLRAILPYIGENYWDGMIQLGDFMDWDWCSRWTAENMRRQENQRFEKEYEGANKFLDLLQGAVRARNKQAEIVILQGNHDYRVEVVMDKQPSLEGKLEMEKNLRLAERKITYWKYWEHRKPYKIGKALFIHGQYTNDAHAKKTALSFNKNVFYGHTHDRQLYTKTTMGQSIQAESLGTLSKYDLLYMGKKPSNWMQCFAVFHFRPNGNFNHYTINIVNHEFTSPEGIHYES